jgi:hypothetical protein
MIGPTYSMTDAEFPPAIYNSLETPWESWTMYWLGWAAESSDLEIFVFGILERRERFPWTVKSDVFFV